MLNEHTFNQLRGLRLDGMVRAIEEQATSTAAAALEYVRKIVSAALIQTPLGGDRIGAP